MEYFYVLHQKQDMKKILLLVAFSLFYSCIQAQLIPDSSFNGTGLIDNQPGQGSSFYPGSILQLADGSVLVSAAREGKLHLWKYDASGNVVSSFGANGEASNANLDLELGHFSFIRGLDTLSNGKIVVLAQNEVNVPSYYDSTKCFIALAVFLPNGTPDVSFNSTGYLISQPNPNYYFRSEALALHTVDTKNEIYVGGWAYEVGHVSCPLGFGKWFVTKFTDNGSLDNTFFSTGYHVASASEIFSSAGSPVAYIRDLKVIGGKLRAVGNLQYSDSRYFSFQLNEDGTWDSTYGTNGRFDYLVSWGVYSNDLSQAKILADNSAIYHTTSRYFGTPDSAVTMLLQTGPSGVINSSFGANGAVQLTYLSQQYPCFAFRQDMSFLLSYYRPYGAQFANQKVEFKKFLADGSIDYSFGVNGWLSTQIINPDTYVNASQVLDAQWDKTETKVYALSFRQPYGSNNSGGFGLMRYKWPGLAALPTVDLEMANRINIYPNPVVNNQVFLDGISNPISIELCTLFGKKIAIDVKPINKHRSVVSWKENVPSAYYILRWREKEVSQSKLIYIQ